MTLDLDEKAMVRSLFGLLDQNRTGRVVASDFHRLLSQRSLPNTFTRRELENLVWEVDSSGQGALTHDDFVSMFVRARADKTGYEPYKLLNIVEFLMYDKAGQGTISLEECILILSRRFGQTNIQGIQADLRKFFLDCAGGRDKRVSFEEFTRQVETRRILLSG
jgi:Ca2+-binding EF-hand superfamily protein